MEQLQSGFAGYTLEGLVASTMRRQTYWASHSKHGAVRLDVLATEALGPAQGFRARYDELASAAPLAHPHLAPILDVGLTDGRWYVVTPRLEGQRLDERMSALRAKDELDIDSACRHASQILTGLAAAHAAGRVHRDLHPHDVVLVPGTGAVVAGLGFDPPRPLEGEAPRRELKSWIRGLSGHAAPEQVLRPEVEDVGADFYAVGSILFQMLVREPLFQDEAEDDSELAEMILSYGPLVPSSIDPAIPRAVDRVVLRALEKSPENRFSGAKFMKKAVEQAAAGEDPEVRLVGRVRYRGWPWPLRMVIFALILQIAHLIIFRPEVLVGIRLRVMAALSAIF